MLSFKHMTRGRTKTQVREEEYEALKQEVHALEPFMRPQFLPQDVSISHDLLTQDAQVLHAQPKKVRLGSSIELACLVVTAAVELSTSPPVLVTLAPNNSSVSSSSAMDPTLPIGDLHLSSVETPIPVDPVSVSPIVNHDSLYSDLPTVQGLTLSILETAEENPPLSQLGPGSKRSFL